MALRQYVHHSLNLECRSGAGHNGHTFNEQSDVSTHQAEGEEPDQPPPAHRTPTRSGEMQQTPSAFAERSFILSTANISSLKRNKELLARGETTACVVFLSLTFYCCSTAETPPEPSSSSSSDCRGFQGLHTSGSLCILPMQLLLRATMSIMLIS